MRRTQTSTWRYFSLRSPRFAHFLCSDRSAMCGFAADRDQKRYIYANRHTDICVMRSFNTSVLTQAYSGFNLLRNQI